MSARTSLRSVAWGLALGRRRRARLLLAVALGALASGSAIALTATSAWLIVRAAGRPPVLELMVAIVAVRTFGIARGVFRYAERLAGHDAAFRVLGDVRVAAVRQLERIVPLRVPATAGAAGGGTGRDPAAAATAAHDAGGVGGAAGPGASGGIGSGEVLARFVGDVDRLQDLWVRLAVPVASAVLVGVATVGLVASLVPGAAVALAASVLVAAALAPALSIAASRGASARLAPLRARYATGVLDVLDGAPELAVYGALGERLDALDRLDAQMRRAGARAAVTAGLGAAVAALAAGAATWCALRLGTGALRAGSIGAPTLAVVVLVPAALHEVVGLLAPSLHELPGVAGAAGRVREVLALPDAVAEPACPAPLPPPEAGGGFGLRVRGLTARWSPDGPDALGPLDLDVPAGSCTVVVGPSGSGKSTLAAVLVRMLDPASGTVELVGAGGRAAPMTGLAADDVRRAVGWCGPDAHVFDSTVEANLRIGRPDATADELYAAMRAARLDAWVDGLPEGMQTLVGEHGTALSGGQRQRLALARTLLADRAVLVLDEPTEHLDEPTAAALASDLAALAPRHTLVVLTHRPELFPTGEGATVLPAHEAQPVRGKGAAHSAQ